MIGWVDGPQSRVATQPRLRKAEIRAGKLGLVIPRALEPTKITAGLRCRDAPSLWRRLPFLIPFHTFCLNLTGFRRGAFWGEGGADAEWVAWGKLETHVHEDGDLKCNCRHAVGQLRPIYLKICSCPLCMTWLQQLSTPMINHPSVRLHTQHPILLQREHLVCSFSPAAPPAARPQL